jgi:hypothetical protein
MYLSEVKGCHLKSLPKVTNLRKNSIEASGIENSTVLPFSMLKRFKTQ